jgi:hypothetical protein
LNDRHQEFHRGSELSASTEPIQKTDFLNGFVTRTINREKLRLLEYSGRRLEDIRMRFGRLIRWATMESTRAFERTGTKRESRPVIG